MNNLPPVLSPGETIGGCRIIHRAGTGAMGEVYLAEHLRMERPVALKVLLTNRLKGGHADRLVREARLGSRIDHPNVIKIYDIGRDREVDYIIMQYIDGINLSQIVKQNGGRLSWRHAVRIIRSAARGLHAVHAEGLVHRDIKPANIMLSREPRVLLMDFGLVQEHCQEAERRIVGTPGYMAPEQCLAQTTDLRSDIFALGGTLYFLLVGAAPFRGSVAQLARVIRDGRLSPPPFQPRLSVPAPVQEIARQAMAADPNRRFADARAMADRLTQTLDILTTAPIEN